MEDILTHFHQCSLIRVHNSLCSIAELNPVKPSVNYARKLHTLSKVSDSIIHEKYLSKFRRYDFRGKDGSSLCS